ncbi:MAG: GGDEF domain-containing protein [Chthonomonadetes bacterium]|nr:GGDEF domain-containing protein [Chthonomonadetes bacterium]
MARLLRQLSLRRRLFIGIFLCMAAVLGLYTIIAYHQIVNALREAGLYSDTSLQVVRRILLQSLLPVLLAGLGISALAAILQIYPVVNLIRRLTLAAHAIASGQFNQRVHASRWAPYDFHLLAESFNLMAMQLEQYALAQKQQQRELQRRNELLEHLSVTDALTQVGNHRAFQEHLHAQINLACRRGLSLCLMLIDVDRFKQLNDTYGHLQGDLVLREVARLITENVRAYDFVARYGGEEFAVILPDTDIETAMVVAERVRQIVEQHPFPKGRVTVSVGVAQWRAGVDPGKLIQEADDALYRAKRAGRNRVCIAEPGEQAA